MKLIQISLLMSFLYFPLFAEPQYNYDLPFGWKSPEIMAQGGAFSSISSGFNSLMTNPAGLAMGKEYNYTETVDESGVRVVRKKEKGEITMIGVAPYSVLNSFSFKDNLAESLVSQSSTDGVELGMQIGGGYVGHGFGFGLITTLDMDFLETDGNSTLTMALVGGYAHSFELGPFILAVGADVRPMWRIKAGNLDMDTLQAMVSGNSVDYETIDVLTGAAIGFDAGIITQWRMLSLSLALRDIGHTAYMYQQSNGQNIQNDLFGGSEYDGLDYITPMSMRIGLSVHPDLGTFSHFLDPKIHMEYVQTMIEPERLDSYYHPSFLENVNVGAEVKLFRFLALRGGISSGYLSAGFGLDLYIAELNAAIYSQNNNSGNGSGRKLGASVEFAFRF